MLRSLSSAGGRRLSSVEGGLLLAFDQLGGRLQEQPRRTPREALSLRRQSHSRPRLKLDFWHPFSSNINPLPVITDPDIEAAFKDLMASSWDETPEGVVHDVKNALSKTTEDKAAQEALANVFRAAEACVEFGAVLVQLRMVLDDLNGIVECPASAARTD